MILPTVTEVRLVGVWDRGVPNQERVALVALAPVSIGEYCLVCGPRDNHGLTPADSYFYKFPDEDLPYGTWCILYTGPGQPPFWTTLARRNEPALVLHWGQGRVVFGPERPAWQPAVLQLSGIAFPSA